MTAGGGGSFYAPDLTHVHHHGYGGFARAAAPEILDLLRRRAAADGVVVDLGCGSGILAAALSDAGYRVIGVDISPAMLDLARTVAPTAEFVLASIHDFVPPPAVAITVVGEGLNYVADREPDLPALFARAHDALAPGGLLLFDLITASDDEPPMRYRVGSEGHDWSVDVEVEEEPDARLVTRRIRTRRVVDGETREALEVHHVRTFPEARVRDALERAGFAVEVGHAYGSLRLAPRRRSFVAAR